MSVAGAAAGHVRPRLLPGRRSARPAPRPRPTCGFAARRTGVPSRPPTRATAATPRVAGQRKSRQGLRRFPERRDGVRREARRARGLPHPPSISSATPRSAWRPTRARPAIVSGAAVLAERHRALYRRGRHHDLPPALHAGRHRRASPAITAGKTSAPRGSRRRMAGPRSRARSSSRPGPGCARSIIRGTARTPGKPR